MQAGKLNKRITIQSAGLVQDDIGEMVPGWPTFAEVWAEITDISGKEYIAAGAVQNLVQTKIRIRYRAGIVASMRAVHGTDTYKIESVLGQDKRSLLLMCSRIA